MFNWNKKETPLLGLQGSGGGLGYLAPKGPSFSASGGTQFVLGGYTYHMFTASGSLVVEGESVNAEYLIVAGGGGGGPAGGGGLHLSPQHWTTSIVQIPA